MLKSPEMVSEEEAEGPERRRGGKLSELGTKMERIFRAAFRKDNLSQSKQQLHPNIEDSHVDDEELEEKKVNTRGKRIIQRAQALDNAEWTSKGSRTSLVKEKSTSREDIQAPDDTKEHKEPRILSTRKVRRLKRCEHVESKDLESTSMDVVVDIHRENSSARTPKNVQETVIDVSSEDLDIEQEILVSNVHQKSLDTSLENSVDSMKKQRKRWSKETHVILPPKRNSLSSSSISDKSSRWTDVEAGSKPVPAPRLNRIINIEKETSLGLNNEAFESEHDDEEQVLRIETDYGFGKGMRIEMKSIESGSEESPDLQKVPGTIERLSEHSDISDIEEINQVRRYSQERKKITSDNSLDHDSEALRKHESSSVSSGKRKKSSRRPLRHLSATGDSTGSTSDVQKVVQVINRLPKDEDNTKKSRTERKRRPTSSSRDSGTSGGSRSTQKPVKKTKTKKSKAKKEKTCEKKFISIKIHRADMLVPDYITRHPMVIVHIVEESTGNYLKDPERSKSKASYLQPLITGTFDFREHKSMVPVWDEELIFEHDFNAILSSGSNQVLILFEIVELPSFAEASSTYDQFGGGNCWYKIAWAFLKPLSSSGTSHVDKVVRLQLYKPKRSLRKSMRPRCEAFSWWKSGSRDKYQSTLFVTVTSVDPPKLEPVFYGQLTLNESDEQTEAPKSMSTSTDPANLSRWSRLAAQSCKIPNEVLFKTEISENGSFYTVFSNNGQYLACANCEEYEYPITVYKIDEGKIFVRFSGHKSFIYALDWSNSDEMLLSVSSDQTARVWDVKNKIIQEIHMLPHPSYVYCGKFEPTSSQIVVTGCYDHTTRLWSRGKNSRDFELVQELEGHEGFVNSICFLKDGDLLTADSVGVIIQWTIKKRRGRSSQDWQILRKIKIREIVNITINTIVLHPLGSRLLVHSRDSGLRMLDLTTGVVLQRYLGLKNLRIQTAARISPCGGLLLCGGEDATLNIWSLESGKHIAKYQTGPSNAAVACVDYHPYDHVLVYSIFGVPSETIVLRFDKQSTGQSVGLKLLEESNNDRGIQEIQSLESSMRSKQRFPRKTFNDTEDTLGNHLSAVNESREDLRSRLKMFNSSEGLLKTRSANRLTSIIAKIDRILSNSGSAQRSSYDIEANRIEESHQHQTPMFSPRQENNLIMPYVPPLFSTFEDNSTSGSKSEMFEMTNLRGDISVARKRGKSKSAQHRRRPSRERNREDEKKTVSDGAVASRRDLQDVREAFEASAWTTVPVGDFESSDIRCFYREKRDESSADSGGTYVVKSDGGRFESESSARSDVTFVIESEKPVPKPRRKRAERHEEIVQIE